MAWKVPNLDWLLNDSYLYKVGEAIQAVSLNAENLSQKVSVNAQGTTQAPAPHSGINVVAAAGVTHISVSDSNPRTNQVHNFVEYGSDPHFGEGSTQTIHMGVSRQVRVPTYMGSTPIYVRSYTQYPDGQRSDFTYHGSQTNPTPVLDGTPSFKDHDGNTVTLQGPPLPASTGSGTSSSPGSGFGRESFIPQPTNPGKPPKIF